MSKTNFQIIKDYIKGEIKEDELINAIIDGVGKSLLSNSDFVIECKRGLAPLLDDEDGDGEIDPPTITELAICSTIVYEAYKIHGLKLKIDKKYIQDVLIEVLVYLIVTSDKLSNRYKKDLVNVVETSLPIAWDLTQNLIEKVKSHFKSKGWCKCICGEKQILKSGQDENGKSTYERHLEDSIANKKKIKKVLEAKNNYAEKRLINVERELSDTRKALIESLQNTIEYEHNGLIKK